MRTFKIIEEASIADPAHVIRLVEIKDDASIPYSDFNVLKELIHKVELDGAKNVGYAEGIDEVLTNLGMSFGDYLEICESKPTKN